MKVAVINCSYYGMKPADRIYNLAVAKIANYHRQRGDEVYAGYWQPLLYLADKYYFSVIFTWDVPKLIGMVNLIKGRRREDSDEPPEIEIGGPAATFLHTYIHKETGIEPHVGLDDRVEHIPGKYKMTFTSRGCPDQGPFCGVKKVEPCALEYA